MTRVSQSPTFKRVIRRLHKNQKADLDRAVRELVGDPERGVRKRGDLSSVRVHKFQMSKQQVLLAYEFKEDSDAIELLALGSHENFYRDLKR